MGNYTIKDVARLAGVSTATVSRVLNGNGYVHESTRKKVNDTIERLKYQPNAIARSLKQERSRSIGFILPDLMNSYFVKIARTIQRELLRQGYHLLMMESEDDEQLEREALELMQEKRVEAIILSGTGHHRQLIQGIRDSGTYIVLVDRKIDGVVVDLVAEDNMVCTMEAISYLLDRHDRIAVIEGPSETSTASERTRAVVERVQGAGRRLPEPYRYPGDYGRESGKAALHYFMSLPDPPTAIFSANNEMTYGVYLGLRELGLKSDSIEVVSFGELELSSLFTHRLSYIQQAPLLVGAAVAELVQRGIQDPEKGVENRILIPRFIRGVHD